MLKTFFIFHTVVYYDSCISKDNLRVLPTHILWKSGLEWGHMNNCLQCVMEHRLGFVRLYEAGGLTAAQVAEMAHVHENTGYNWLGAYAKWGEQGLLDESRAPKTHPNEYSDEIKEAIRFLRQEGLAEEKRHIGEKVISHRLMERFGIEASHSGIGKFLQVDALIPAQKKRRPKKERADRCRIHEPGELVQMDVKYAVKNIAGYWFYQYDCIDYVTDVVFGEIYPIQSNYESVRFLGVVLQRSPFSIQGWQTDNHSTFTNYYTGYQKSADPSKPRLHALDLACARYEIIHYLIDPGKPAQNGKIERFHRTAEDEFYQTNTFNDLNSLKRKFRHYLHYYNNEREHSALGYLTPLEKLRTFGKYENIKSIKN